LRETWLKPPPGENVVRGSLIAVLSIKSTFIDPIWKGPGCFVGTGSRLAGYWIAVGGEIALAAELFSLRGRPSILDIS